jgi:hypothetical protein
MVNGGGVTTVMALSLCLVGTLLSPTVKIEDTLEALHIFTDQ